MEYDFGVVQNSESGVGNEIPPDSTALDFCYFPFLNPSYSNNEKKTIQQEIYQLGQLSSPSVTIKINKNKLEAKANMYMGKILKFWSRIAADHLNQNN